MLGIIPRYFKPNRSPNQIHPFALQTCPHSQGAPRSATRIHSQVPGEPHGVFLFPYPAVSKLCPFDPPICPFLSNPIVTVSVQGRGSSSFSRATAFQGLYLPSVMFLSKPFSTSFQHGPSIMPTLSSPCLRLTGTSLLPKIVVLQVWCLDRSISITRELVRNADSQAPLECLLNQTLCRWGAALRLSKPSKRICSAKFENHY